MDYFSLALKKHEEWRGKISLTPLCPLVNKDDLSTAYTPGVAAPCLEIKDDPSLAYRYTRKWNMVAVITDGSAVLGLGNIGPLAGLPVMEGKSVLFKSFGNV
ncbi:NAD-dependent malic enzyme, partial [bacterium]|nr:NAD-dependent malic enzyme [bacterium]